MFKNRNHIQEEKKHLKTYRLVNFSHSKECSPAYGMVCAIGVAQNKHVTM
jgi:hypothetical protein